MPRRSGYASRREQREDEPEVWIGAKSGIPALSGQTTCNISGSMGKERELIGADRDPCYVKLRREYNSLAENYQSPAFGADPQIEEWCPTSSLTGIRLHDRTRSLAR